VSLVDKALAPAAPGDDTLAIEVTCTNRDLPARLPFGGGVGDFELEAAGAVARVAVLRKPTPTLRPDLRGGMQWRLISHLGLDHLSIVDGGRDALLEILSLYNIGDSLAGRRQIGGITAVAAKPDLARIGPPRYGAFCRGTAVEIEYDEDQYVGGSAYLLASVLERFLGLYAAVNSFTRLTARSKQRERVLAAWPPRIGDKFLL
jgi:type VI secretion system protein ImpG